MQLDRWAIISLRQHWIGFYVSSQFVGEKYSAARSIIEKYVHLFLLFSFAKEKSILLLRTFVDKRDSRPHARQYEQHLMIHTFISIISLAQTSEKIGDPMPVINPMNADCVIATFAIIFCFQMRLTIDLYVWIMLCEINMYQCYVIVH